MKLNYANSNNNNNLMIKQYKLKINKTYKTNQIIMIS